MKRLAVMLMLTLGACATTIPAVPKFPQPPVDLQDPPPLTPLRDGAMMSDLLQNAAQNYGQYHVVSAKLRAWNRWYDDQLTLFNKKK